MRVNEYHSFVFQMQETRTRLRRLARETVSVNKLYTSIRTQSANPPDGFAARYRSKSARLPALRSPPKTSGKENTESTWSSFHRSTTHFAAPSVGTSITLNS